MFDSLFPWFLSFWYLRFFITIPHQVVAQTFAQPCIISSLARFHPFSFPLPPSHRNPHITTTLVVTFSGCDSSLSLPHSLYCSFNLSHVKVLAVFKGIQETEIILGLESLVCCHYPLRFCYENAMRGHVCSHTV